MSALRLNLEDIKGVFAVMPTPALPNGDQVNEQFTVDIDEARRAADALVRDGIDGIMLTGTFGESATLTEEEWKAFTKTVVEAVNGRIPVVAGPLTLNTRDTIARAAYAREVGASGIMLGRPFWCELPSDAVIDFYKDVAKALPDIGIIIYNNPSAFKSKITPAMWSELADIPQVVGSKYGSFNEQYPDCVKAVNGRIRLMTMEKDWYKAYQLFPEHNIACWSGGASCHPKPVVSLREAIFSGDHSRAEYLTNEIAKTYETFFPRGDRELFRLFTIQVEKLRIQEGGYMNAGPSRPPYNKIPIEFEIGAREAGSRWRKLADRLAEQHV